MHISDYSANLYRINTHFLYMKTFFHTVRVPGNLQASKWFPRALINRRVRCLPLRPFSPFLRALIAAAAAVHAMATAIIVTIKKPLGVIWLLCVAPFSRPRFFFLRSMSICLIGPHDTSVGQAAEHGKRNENINLPPKNQ